MLASPERLIFILFCRREVIVLSARHRPRTLALDPRDAAVKKAADGQSADFALSIPEGEPPGVRTPLPTAPAAGD